MYKPLILTLLFLFFLSCSDKSFSQDIKDTDKVQKKFNERFEFASNRSDKLFNVFSQKLSTEEEIYLKFLYAYMPLCDLADYDGEFFLMQVRTALKAKQTFSWGKNIPEPIFRHFVLPYRVNNENLDTARSAFYTELKDRIKNLSLYDAALEVNHWCHEKVTYQSSDGRTSAPLSTVKTSWGRCGEESTFLVTALRSVGIPARQVYTPRWAHVDDNHAWVEVWVDGKWYYLGACEPEPQLNMGWFTEPSRRAMLVNTTVFGNYSGDEEVMIKTNNYTKINCLSNYAETKKLYVRVIDSEGFPAVNASVEFGLYNYAEFYPQAKKDTDNDGLCYLTTGFGDLLIWVNKNDKYGYKKITVSAQDTVSITLSELSGILTQVDYNFTPPVEKTPLQVNETLNAENQVRLSREDSIRASYQNTFIDSVSAVGFAKAKRLDVVKTNEFLKASWGNWKEIKKFLDNADSNNQSLYFNLLDKISKKDLRDTKASILNDHLQAALLNTPLNKYKDADFYFENVLNPRIKNENLLEYRSKFQKEFSSLIGEDFQSTSENIIKWIKQNVTTNETDNYYNLPLTPMGVCELKISNAESRDIFFVAVARSLGVPARLEPAILVPQYYNGKQWMNVFFSDEIKTQPEKGYLQLITASNQYKIEPHYYIHFSIGKLVNRSFKTIEYPDDKPITEFPDKIELETGIYRLITGNRALDGTVLTRLSYFEIKNNDVSKVNFEMRDYKNDPVIFGSLDRSIKLMNDNGTIELKELLKNELQLIWWIDPDREPTKHALNDLRDLKEKFESWDGNILLIIPEEKRTASLNSALFDNLPANINYFVDPDNKLSEKVKNVLKLQKDIQLPLIIAVKNNGDIIMYSTGYKIGIGEQLLKIIL